jgi:pimeloyl-ACP methyl ester carboxylesterase
MLPFTLPSTDLRIHGGGADAPALVLLHMFGSSRREWLEVGLSLGAEFRVISIDAPGFGEARDCEGYSVAAMARQFAETIAALQVKQFTLVGHSMTGKVAAVLAGRSQAGQSLPGLEKLALLTPSPLGPEPIPPKARASMLAQTGASREDAETFIRSNSSLPMREDVFERAVEDRMRANPAAWQAWLENGSREDWSARFARLSLPTLVIAAEKDSSLGPEVQERLTLPHFPGARMEIIRASGHMVPMEAPEQLASLLRAFALR